MEVTSHQAVEVVNMDLLQIPTLAKDGETTLQFITIVFVHMDKELSKMVELSATA